MADAATAEAESEEAERPGILKPLIFGIVGMLIASGGGFFVTYSGLLGGGGGDHAEDEHKVAESESVEFVRMDPLTVSLGRKATARQLKFSAQLEVEPNYREEIEVLLPRVVDVLNTFLRAVDETELEDPTAMVRLRAQMLRRIQVVTGEGRVKDLLIMEFVFT